MTITTELFQDTRAPLTNAKLQVTNALLSALEKGVTLLTLLGDMSVEYFL